MGKTIWMLIVGTIPVGLIGLFLRDRAQALFSSPVIVSLFSAPTVRCLLFGEATTRGRRAEGRDRVEQEEAFRDDQRPNLQQAFFIGLSQSLALLPGISRSGVTMVASLRAKLSHEEALRFTFLLATPVILLAGLLEIPKISRTPTLRHRYAALAGGVSRFFAALVSVTFLSRYFRVGD